MTGEEDELRRQPQNRDRIAAQTVDDEMMTTLRDGNGK
jgi:hypothetical protein